MNYRRKEFKRIREQRHAHMENPSFFNKIIIIIIDVGFENEKTLIFFSSMCDVNICCVVV